MIGIGWVIVKMFEGISNVSIASQNRKKLKEERKIKYGNRKVDTTKSLFERNVDIIRVYKTKIRTQSTQSYSSGNYYIENQTRDCINEIGLAEENFSARSNSAYLSKWRSSAPKEWVKLSEQIEEVFRDQQKRLIAEERAIQIAQENEAKKKNEEQERIERKGREERDRLKNTERQIDRNIATINSRLSNRIDPLVIRNMNKRGSRGNILIEDLSKILRLNTKTWLDHKNSINIDDLSPFPKFETDLKLSSVDELNKKIEDFNKLIETDKANFTENKKFFAEVIQSYKEGVKEDIIQYFNYVLDSIELPNS